MKLLSTEVARNYALNPAAAGGVGTGFGSYLAGTGETGTTSWVTGAADGPAGTGITSYGRRAITAAKTAASSGWQCVAAANRAPLVGVAGAVVTVSVYLRYSGAAGTTLKMRATLHDAAGTQVSLGDSGTLTLPANVWTRVSATVTATAAFESVGWWAYHVAGNTPAAGTNYDATGALVEKGGTVGPWFSGATAGASGYVPGVTSYAYAWTGPVNASASTKGVVLANLLAEPLADGPWVGVTVRGLTAGNAVLTLWRSAGGERWPVRQGRDLEAVDSAFVIDYEAPLGQLVTYDLEVTAGPDAGAVVPSASAVVESASGVIHDPLDPTAWVPVWAWRAPNGEPGLSGTAFRALTRAADVSTHNILGARLPVAIGGPRRAPSGVDLSVLTDAEVQNTRLRDMLDNSSVLVVRLPPDFAVALPPVAFVSLPEVVEVPLTARLPTGTGRFLTRWEMVGDVVRPSAAGVLIALFTYQEVEALFSTYNQKQASAGGGTYLDDQKNPFGT